MKNFVKSYLQFSKRERLGLLVVLVLLIFFFYLPQLVKPTFTENQTVDTAWLKGVEYIEPAINTSNGGSKPVRYFYFDPNTATAEQLQTLGLTPKNTQTILRYRSKGGQFRTAEDILKIWGINSDISKALIPYIRIAPSTTIQKQLPLYKSGDYHPPYTAKKIPLIDINIANTADWEALPGIGPVLAARIVKYRDKIGGFAEIENIQNVYGIKDSLFFSIKPYLLLQNTEKPSINRSSEAILIKVGVAPATAAAIVLYRKQYGLFENLSDLRKIVFIGDIEYEALLKLVTL